MAMLDHFFGHQFDLDGLVSAFRAKHGDRYDVVTTLDPAHVETSEPASAYAVAEFMLNLLPISRPPTRRDVTAYLDRHANRRRHLSPLRPSGLSANTGTRVTR